MDLTTAYELELEPSTNYIERCTCSRCSFFGKYKTQIIKMYFIGFIFPIIWIFLFVALVYGLYTLGNDDDNEDGDADVVPNDFSSYSRFKLRKPKSVTDVQGHVKYRDAMKELSIYCILSTLMYGLLGFMVYVFETSPKLA